MAEEGPVRDHSHPAPIPAIVEDADTGTIHGAFGTIRVTDQAPRRTWRRRLLTLAAIIGPGLIVMVGDNDAGGVSTYAQAGQDFGYSLLWTLVLLVPVLIVNQEMVVRLGAVTGVGHARLITERFGRAWGWYSVAGLFLLSFLTISTEFMGVTLAAEYFGFNRYVVVPLAALMLVAITVTGNFRLWERAMFVFVFASLLVLPLVVLSHPDPGAALHGLLVPGVEGGFTSNATLLIVAIVGTTVAPWQLFFQQSNVIDKRTFGDIFGLRHSLHRGLGEAKLFYASFTAMVAVAAAIVLIPHAPLGLITTAVQALAGILLPSSTVFLVLLCNDRAVLGPWANKAWLNVVATFIVGALLLLSLILVISTVFPSIDVTKALLVLGPLTLAVLIGVAVRIAWRSRQEIREPEISRIERESWRMPALALLERPKLSPARTAAMAALGVYIGVAVVMLVVKAAQIAIALR